MNAIPEHGTRVLALVSRPGPAARPWTRAQARHSRGQPGHFQLLYAGTADPWHEPMQAFVERSGVHFLSISDADHKGCWDRSTDVLPTVLPFLVANAGMP